MKSPDKSHALYYYCLKNQHQPRQNIYVKDFQISKYVYNVTNIINSRNSLLPDS